MRTVYLKHSKRFVNLERMTDASFRRMWNSDESFVAWWLYIYFGTEKTEVIVKHPDDIALVCKILDLDPSKIPTQEGD